jgi:Dolichyl-phosphate-mannose-protein mannosyltransferase
MRLWAVVQKPYLGMLLGCALGFAALGFVAVHAGSVPPNILWLVSHLLAGLWLWTGAVIWWQERKAGHAPSAEGASLLRRERFRSFLASSDAQFLFVVLALSAMLRFVDLEHMPWGYAGIHIDAAYNSEVSFRILDRQQYFSPVLPSIAYYRDALIHYYLVPFFGLFGRGIVPLRLAMNALALLNVILLFLILRRYTSSRPVIYGCTAFYALWGCDIIFGLSGVEYVMVTPFLLGSFYLLLRTMDSGSRLCAVSCGLVWGLGFSSHYSYLGLSIAIPVVIAATSLADRRWLRAFIKGSIWGALPKACYLLFGSQVYFQRFSDVLSHDNTGRFLVAQALWGNLTRLGNLLFVDQIYDKWYLPSPKLLPALAWPLLVLGFWLAARRLRQPHHCFAITISAVVLGANLLTFPMDYRWMNWIPIMVILFAVVAEAFQAMSANRGRLMVLWWVALGVLLIRSTADYFYVRPEPQVMENYGCAETAQARLIVGGPQAKKTYIFAPHLTYRTAFLNQGRTGILDANFELDWQTQVTRSAAGETIVLRNLQRIAEKNRASNDMETISLWVSHESPYHDLVTAYLLQHFQGKSIERSAADPVSGKTFSFTEVSFFTP